MLTKLEERKDYYRVKIPKDFARNRNLEKDREYAITWNSRGNIELKEITLPFSVVKKAEK